jgi:hypothetical protein
MPGQAGGGLAQKIDGASAATLKFKPVSEALARGKIAAVGLRRSEEAKFHAHAIGEFLPKVARIARRGNWKQTCCARLALIMILSNLSDAWRPKKGRHKCSLQFLEFVTR